MLTAEQAAAVAADLLAVRREDYAELHRIHEAAEGDIPPGYIPRDARQEFRWLVEQSPVNLISKIVDSHVASLFVDGYRSPEAKENLESWSQWQANRMDARQTGVHRCALEYGTSYVRVLPGDTAPAWAPFSPRDLTAVYADSVNDEWPEYAMTVKGEDSRLAVDVIAPDFIYHFTAKNADDTRPEFTGADRHGVPWCPVVRFQSDYSLDDDSRGLVEPLMSLQAQVNLTSFSLMIAMQFSAFKQKWVSGLELPRDEQDRPIEPFKAAVNRLFVAEGEGTKFGQFDATDLGQYLAAREDAVRLMSTIGNVPPHTVLGALANLSAESLAAAEVSKTRYEDTVRLLFGEAWEQTFRLSRYVAGETEAVNDVSAQVVWRDTEARSQAQITDAAVKLRSIGFPISYIAEMLGTAPQDLPQLLADIDAETTSKAVAQAQSFGVMAAPSGEDAAAIKAKADAMGVLIRAGVDPQDAADKVGMGDVDFTGAVPTSLRLPTTDARSLEGGSGP